MKAEFIPSNFSNWKDLEHARKWAHRALQLGAIVPRGILPPDPGDGYANFGWDPGLKMLVSQPFGGAGYRTALRISDLSILFLQEPTTISELNLQGFSQDQAFQWIKEEVGNLGESTDRLTLDLPYQIPEYPDIDDRPFQVDVPEALKELSNYFGNAHLVLERFKSGNDDISEIRCWPHHFDIATLLSLDNNPDPESAKSIGVGLSPGDENYNMPYYYITPWPYPDVTISKLPPFTNGGEWNTDGWVGALLMADEIHKGEAETDQLEIITNFVDEAVSTFKELIE